MEKDIIAEWRTYIDWLNNRIPALANRLEGPEDAAMLDQIEDLLKVPLPREYRALCLENNGQTIPPLNGIVLGYIFEPQSLELLKHWLEGLDDLKLSYLYEERAPEDVKPPKLSSTPPGHIKLTQINPRWLPFLHDGGGNYIGLDLDPGPLGKFGQVINFGRDHDPQYVYASDLTDFFRKINAAVAAGTIDWHIDPTGENGYFVDLLIREIL